MKADRYLPFLLFGLALVPRLVFWAEWNHAGLLALPVVDAHTFDQEARRLLLGAWPGAEPFWQAPLFSFFLAGIYRVAGIHWEAARLAHAFLGAGSCLLLWRLARRLLGRRASLIAFGICAVYGPLLYYEGQLLRETLATFLLLLWALVHFGMSGREDHRNLRWGLSGLLLGLASICRENAVILAPVALVWALARHGSSARDRPAALRRRLPAAALFAGGMCLVIAPLTVFNWTREGALIPISSSGGINFFLGNNAESRRTLEIRPGRFWLDLVDRPRREAGATTAAARSGFFYREAFRWIASHPLAFAGNTLYKTVGLFTGQEIKRNQGIYEARQGSVLLRVLLWKAGPFGFPFGIVGPLSLLGLFLAIRRAGPEKRKRLLPRESAGTPAGSAGPGETEDPRAPGLAFLAALTLAYMGGIILFFPNARYRAPLVPFLSIFAALAMERLLSRRPARGRLVPVLFLAGAVLLVDGGWVRAREDPADQAFLRATALAEEQRTGEAIAELAQATRLNPRHGEAWTTLAALYGMNGRLEESMRAARTALAIDSTDAQAWVNLSNDLVETGDLPTAEKALRRALSFRPDLSDAWLNLGSIQMRNGDDRAAEASFRRALAFEPDLSKARNSLAQQLIRQGRLAEGRACLEEGLRRNPDDATLWFSMGNVEGHTGRWQEAAAAFQRCLALTPGNADAWNNYGLILAQMGRTSEARSALERALKLQPGHPRALANLRRLGFAP